LARRRLGREIGVLLAAKLILLCALYFAFFDSGHRVIADAQATSARLLGARGN